VTIVDAPVVMFNLRDRVENRIEGIHAEVLIAVIARSTFPEARTERASAQIRDQGDGACPADGATEYSVTIQPR